MVASPDEFGCIVAHENVNVFNRTKKELKACG